MLLVLISFLNVYPPKKFLLYSVMIYYNGFIKSFINVIFSFS